MSINEIKNRMIDPINIEILENILDEVKEGKVCSIALAFVYNNATSGNVFSEGSPLTLVGELECLKREILDTIDTRLHKAGEEY